MQVGSLVVCVRAGSSDYRFKPLVLNKIYTVRGIFKGTLTGGVKGDGILLEEIINGFSKNGNELGYNINRFRELDTPVSINIEELIYEKV